MAILHKKVFFLVINRVVLIFSITVILSSHLTQRDVLHKKNTPLQFPGFKFVNVLGPKREKSYSL